MSNNNLTNMIFITQDDVDLLDNDGKGYCLIYAFFQGIHESRQSEKDRNICVSEAMKLVIDKEEEARDLSANARETIGKWYDRYKYPLENLALKRGEFWTYELLEFYIRISQIKAQIYYFYEFKESVFVMVKTRHSMERIPECKVVILLERMNGHKLLIRKVNAVISIEELIDNTNFSVLIDTSDVSSPYNNSTFISIDLCRKVKVTNDFSCGYASIAKSIGRSTLDFIKNLSEYYLNEFKGLGNHELFSKGNELSEWVRKRESKIMPYDLRLTSEDG